MAISEELMRRKLPVNDERFAKNIVLNRLFKVSLIAALAFFSWGLIFFLIGWREIEFACWYGFLLSVLACVVIIIIDHNRQGGNDK